MPNKSKKAKSISIKVGDVTEMEAIQVATDHPESIPATGVSAAAAIPGTMAR